MTSPSQKHERLYVALAALVIVVLFTLFRWQAINFNEEIMVDESMFLADAMRANQYGYTPWHRYDSVTSGPLNTIPLAILLRLGFPANFVMLHAFAAFLQALSYICVTILCVRLAGLWTGLAVGLGSAALFAFQQLPDFTHYSSGLMPFLLLAFGWLLAIRRDPAGSLRLSVGGSIAAAFVFAMAPLAKTQASVPAFACWIGLAAWLCFQFYREARVRSAALPLVAMGLAGALPFIFTAAALWSAGALAYFHNSFEALRFYAGALQPMLVVKDLAFLIINSVTRGLFTAVLATAIFLTVLLLPRWRADSAPTPASLAALAAMALWLGAALFAVAVPKNYTIHYEVFLYGPATLFVAAFVGALCSAPARKQAATTAAVVAAAAFTAVAGTMFGPAFKRNFVPNQPSPAALPMDAEQRTTVALRELGAKSGETLFIWGWAPAVYVHTGMIPATRFSWAQPCTTRFPGYPVFREAMMADLLESRPRFIVDTMQSGYGMNTVGAHIGYYSPDRDLTAQSFYPELAAMGYEWVQDIPLANGTKGIIYRLRAR
jgi:hypothetical protein